MIFVRSYAAATFLLSRGHKPLDADTHALPVVFAFSDEARSTMSEYHETKRALDAFVAERQAERAAS